MATYVKMSQWQVIDIMTYNSYSLQYYSFWKGKIGFARTVPVFLDNANSHQALQYNNITVSKNDFLRYSLTVDSFWKRIFCVTILTAYSITEEVSIISWLSVDAQSQHDRIPGYLGTTIQSKF